MVGTHIFVEFRGHEPLDFRHCLLKNLNFLIKLVDIKINVESEIVQMAKCVQYAVVTL